MDPISTSASVLTLLGAAGGTCKLLYSLILDLKDAPEEIRRQNRKLQCLQENITCLLQICDKLPGELQLAARFDGVQEFIQEVNNINMDIEIRRFSLDRGKGARVKGICRWLLFDRHLKRFFGNLEHYNIVLSHAVSAAGISLLVQIREQTSAICPMRICPQIQDHNKIPPNTSSIMKSIDSVESRRVIPGLDTGFNMQEKRLLARLSKRVETVSPLLRRRWELGLGSLKFDVRHGPSIIRRWSQQGQEMFSSEGQALAIILDCDRFICQRFTLVLCIMQRASSISRLTLTSNLSVTSIVPSQDPTFTAIRLGDIDHMKRMIMTEPSILSTVIRGGYTLLHCAARYGRHDILSILVANGADINTTNDRGETPLHIAIKQGRDHACVQHLLELGAQPSQPDTEGRTALHMFYNPVTAYMFQFHSNEIDTWAQDIEGRTILHYLAWSSQSTTQELMRCLQSVDTPQLSIKDSEGRSILHYAAQRGNSELINFLLGLPGAATLCMPDHHNRTLLHHATESGRVSTIDLFLARQLDPGALDDQGHTMLHHACQWGNLKAVKHLVDLGFEYQLDAVDGKDLTPLQLARHYRSEAVVEYLERLRPEKEYSHQESDKQIVAHGLIGLSCFGARSSSTKALLLSLLILFISYKFLG